MALYESNRVVFNTIVKKYNDYLRLYASLNNGSVDGAVPFDQFYWRYTYATKYAESDRVGDKAY